MEKTDEREKAAIYSRLKEADTFHSQLLKSFYDPNWKSNYIKQTLQNKQLAHNSIES